MKISSWRYLVIVMLLSVAFLSACGGGGGGGAAPPPATTSLSGVASKGLLSGATVTAYSLNASGIEGSALGSDITDANGAYSINVGSYTGAVILKATGGSYVDEATGATTTNTVLLRAAVTNVSGSVQAAITPMTEIAVLIAGELTTANIDGATALLSNMIGGTDIIGTMPANVLVSSASSTAAKNYGLMLAALSQLVSDGTATGVSDAIGQLAADLADTVLDATGPDVSSSLSTFLSGTFNKTGLTTGTAPLVAALSSASSNHIPSYALKGSYRSITQLTGFFPYTAASITHAAHVFYGNTGALAFDGKGSCSAAFSGTSYEMYPLTNSVDESADPPITQPCTYVLASSGTITIDTGVEAPLTWRASIDGGVLAHGAPTGYGPGSTVVQQTIAIRAGSGMKNASLNGTYAMVGQEFGFSYPGTGATETTSHFYGDDQTITFDGAGNFTSSGNGWYYEMHHATNTIIRNPEPWIDEPGTYSVAGDGSLSVAGGTVGGWVSADSNVILFGGIAASGNEYVTLQQIAVKLGSSMTVSSLSGTFLFAGQYAGFFLATGASGTVAGSMVHDFADTMSFDGNGVCTYTQGAFTEYRMSEDMVSIETNPGGQVVHGTYAVADNGATTISLDGFNIPAWLSANGNVMIWGGGGWSDTNFTGGAVPVPDESPVWAEQALGVKVQ